jgi:protein Tex
MTTATTIQLIAQKLGISNKQISNTILLLDEGGTVPFISRYRKEMTGSLDEVAIGDIKDAKERFEEIEKRKTAILKSIEEQDLLSSELKSKLQNCYDLNELEDIYLPYKPKRRTRATVARENGLEPLAKLIYKQFEADLEHKAFQFLTDVVVDVDSALAGARDIIAEWINEDPNARTMIRNLFDREATIISKVVKGKEEAGIKFSNYFSSSEGLKRCPSHRLLAMRRGEKEGFLKLSIDVDEIKAVGLLERYFVKSRNACAAQMELAIRDCYKRLLAPAIENEFFASSKEKADLEAIRVFAENLRQLLLAAPLGQKRVLALDPGYKSGCKLVCLDAEGNLLHNETIYPHQPQGEVSQSIRKVSALVSTYKIDAIAIGDGTASRETEAFIKKITFDRTIQVFVVSEDGASIYSASKIARDEFPQYDVTVRGSVSIGRRLMDPLAELVKIEAKSIGVGQYQHDVDQKMLQKGLDSVVESAVNLVGVNVNTASSHLLNFVSGLGPLLAQNIVEFRKENGPFANRATLKKVPRMGAKAYEQCAGFLRITGGEHPLDNSAVHPERYALVSKIAADRTCKVADLIGREDLRKELELDRYISDEVGLPTLTDILTELAKPGLDPRTGIKVFEFADGIFSMSDLHVGMILPGIVTNITRFGAFVDVGVKQDGLVHISELANKYISDPAEVVKLHQHVKVKVLEVDVPRKRIAFSMKQAES